MAELDLYGATIRLVNELKAVCESAANWGAVLEDTEGERNVANARVASARRLIEEVEASGLLKTRKYCPPVYTDKTPMPFGKYQSVPLGDIPAAYLHWLWSSSDNPLSGRTATDPLASYIARNLAALIEEYPDGLGWED